MHTAKSQEVGDSVIFLLIFSDIAETFTVLMLRISAVWILLNYEKEVCCVGFGHHS